MTRALLFLVLIFSLAFLPAAKAEAPRHTFVIGEKDFLLDGKPFVIRCGEIHFARVPREYWQQRLKMAKAMGLNAVCVYLFWNKLEWTQGRFDWTGENDAAEFCRLAQQEGLWVLLRPGPYACAEWDGGGLPWWLLKDPTIKLRNRNPAFMDPAKAYLKEVGRVLGPQQITKGGPLLMVQVENEYGSYGKDVDYMGDLRQATIDAGFDVPLFACNPGQDIKNGLRPDLFQVVNFGHNPKWAFETLRKYQPTGPQMNGEFYPGWFDTWGNPHRTGSTDGIVGELDYMLKNGMSFSIYMAHGGTTWGLWSGADQPFSPDTTSYDYDAPISEAGHVTEKFTRIRELFSKYLQPGETLPEPPPSTPVITIPAFTLTETAPMLSNLPTPVKDEEPRTMDKYDQGHGCIMYETTLPAGPKATLHADIHDFGWVFLDSKQVGVLDRRSRKYDVRLPERTAPAKLQVMIETVGRVNFGPGINDRKGLYAPVKLGDATLKDWQVYSFPLDAAELASLKYQPAGTEKVPAFWRGSFDLTQTGDTWFDVRSWGKGVVWVNGRCLGRFWNIGPTQTMVVPAPWLKTGRNEVVVLDMIGPVEAKLAGLDTPILNEVRRDLDFAKKVRAQGTFTVDALTPALTGSFPEDAQKQEAKFPATATGRYVALQVLNAQDGKEVAAMAEFDLLDAARQPLPRADWKVLWVDSEAPGKEAENALDGQTSSQWESSRKPEGAAFPHTLVIDLGTSMSLTGLRYLPSTDTKNPGHVKDYRVYVSETPFGLVEK